MKRFSLRYALMTYKLDQFYLPLAFFGLFVVMSFIMMNTPQFMHLSKIYLGTAMPLLSGILGAYAILEDPALELRFATPISAARTLLERLGLLLVSQVAL
ncbi:hypothetical protein EG834_06530, partial [bacterium]|nr:hypothetical protein [bacterium]